MKISYVRGFILIMCMTIIQSAQCNEFAQVLDTLLIYYPAPSKMLENISLTLPNGGGTVKGIDIAPALSKLQTVPDEWMKSKWAEKSPLQIVTSHVASNNSDEKTALLSIMIKKLFTSGAQPTVDDFFRSIEHPECFLEFVKWCNVEFWAEVAKHRSSKLVIGVVLDKMMQSKSTQAKGYTEALRELLKTTGKGYIILPRTLEFFQKKITSDDGVFKGALEELLGVGVLAAGEDYGTVFQGLMDVAIDIDNEYLATLFAQRGGNYINAKNFINKVSAKFGVGSDKYETYCSCAASYVPGIEEEHAKKWFEALVKNHQNLINGLEFHVSPGGIWNVSLAEKVRCDGLVVNGYDLGKDTVSRYFCLMAYIAPTLSKKDAEKLTHSCNQWLKEQTQDDKAAITQEVNGYGQTALYAAIDLHAPAKGKQTALRQSLLVVVQALGEAGFNPEATAEKSYRDETVQNENSRTLMSKCGPELMEAFNKRGVSEKIETWETPTEVVDDQSHGDGAFESSLSQTFRNMTPEEIARDLMDEVSTNGSSSQTFRNMTAEEIARDLMAGLNRKTDAQSGGDGAPKENSSDCEEQLKDDNSGDSSSQPFLNMTPEEIARDLMAGRNRKTGVQSGGDGAPKENFSGSKEQLKDDNSGGSSSKTFRTVLPGGCVKISPQGRESRKISKSDGDLPSQQREEPSKSAKEELGTNSGSNSNKERVSNLPYAVGVVGLATVIGLVGFMYHKFIKPAKNEDNFSEATKTVRLIAAY